LPARNLETTRIEAELMEHGGMNVSDIMALADGMKADRIGFAVNDAALDAAAGEPGAKGLRMMVAAVAFGARRAAELGPPDDERFVEQTALLEVGEQAGDGTVDFIRQAAVIGADAGMGIPFVAPAAAVKDLDETDASFNETPRRQALPAETARRATAHAVKRADVLGFAFQCKRFRDRGLHAVSKLVCANAGTQLRVVGIVDARECIEPAEQAEFRLLLFGRSAAQRPHKRQWLLRFGIEADAGKFGAEIAAAMRPFAAAAIARRRAEDDVFGQVLIERAQPVAGPRANGRIGALARVPAGVVLEHRPVIVMRSPERTDDRDIVRMGAGMPPPIADEQAALTVARHAGGQPHEDAAIAVTGIAADDVGPLTLHGVGIGSIGDIAAMVAIQLQLGVEALEMADAAAHEQPDDVFGFWREMRTAVRRRVVRSGFAVAKQHGAEGEAGEAHAGVGEELAPCSAAAGVISWSHDDSPAGVLPFASPKVISPLAEGEVYVAQ